MNPPNNDGATLHRRAVRDVPVGGFWSVTVYNKDGYFTPNSQNAYSLNNIVAEKRDDGSVEIQFGGCDREEILDGSWTFPVATPD